ncbi:hypothetical protein GCM10022198_03580 [Klugiella xanthotipulae]|uniref:FHA domain-containing protein n=1 Tax=Klugiella xanthotipulae TaxID=244735 RepID=A0A543I715_9MICO|nr:FHA domain-containing protein [Klugiella xanthotipulae]TQM66345.1 hypothetical protein FB466_1185 [Klugiella xanthotipulae]
MTTSARFDIDLHFEVHIPASPSGESRQITGRIEAAGADIVLHCSEPEIFLDSGASDPALFRALAEVLATHGTTFAIHGPQGLIVRAGSLKNPLVQRLLTRSRHIEIGSASTFAALLGQRLSEHGTARPSPLLPPPTLSPILPTFLKRRRRRVTTTNYAYGAGRPRLIFVVDSARWDGRPPRTFDLTQEVTSLGSSPLADLVLAGSHPFHAEIRHTEEDEYALFPLAPMGLGIDPAHTTAEWAQGGVALRTGARLQIGEWKLAFFREEYADHGRPFGGRAGGEWAHQSPQPARRIHGEENG